MINFIKRIFKRKPKKRTTTKGNLVRSGINRSQGNKYRQSDEQFTGADERTPGRLEDLYVEP